MNNVQEHLPAGVAAPAVGLDLMSASATAGSAKSMLPSIAGDRIRQLMNPGFAESTGLLSGFGAWGVIQQLLAIIQQLFAMLGFGARQQPGPQTYYQNATASSTGDPHLAFNGTNQSGGNDQTHFDSMTSHTGLLDSDSFTGGYTISTVATQPNANGITYNQKASITTNFGQTEVTLEKDGDAYLAQNGRRYEIAKGSSVDLGNGESVARNNDGSLVVTDWAGQGGRITTTLSLNGSGVDVNGQANAVDLGGDLVTTVRSPA